MATNLRIYNLGKIRLGKRGMHDRVRHEIANYVNSFISDYVKIDELPDNVLSLFQENGTTIINAIEQHVNNMITAYATISNAIDIAGDLISANNEIMMNEILTSYAKSEDLAEYSTTDEICAMIDNNSSEIIKTLESELEDYVREEELTAYVTHQELPDETVGIISARHEEVFDVLDGERFNGQLSIDVIDGGNEI